MSEVSGPHMSDQMPKACGMACAAQTPLLELRIIQTMACAYAGRWC